MDFELKDVVLKMLEAGPLDRAAIMAGNPEIENDKQLSNCLFRLKEAGKIRKNDAGEWELGKSREGAPKRAKRPRVPRIAVAQLPGKRRRSKAGSGGVPKADLARSIFEKALLDVQSALDEYVSQIGDPHILAPLRAMRDSARAALAAFVDSTTQ